MENTKDSEQKPLINELTQIKELVNELRYHLSPNSSKGEFLIEKILSISDNALLMLTWNGSEVVPQVTRPGLLDSPLSGSSRSVDSEIKDVYKRRKTMPRWTEQVRVSSGAGLEAPAEDGHSWRKYGQKDILGAKYPRGYYRCTHRHAEGCFATKQVQRSDEDPLTFDVTYRGKHTCKQASFIRKQNQDQNQNQDTQMVQRKRKNSDDLLQRFQTELKVKTEIQDNTELMTPSPFSFPSTAPIEYVQPQNNIFSSVSLENNYIGSFTSLISPTTPESQYFSPCHMNNIGGRSSFPTSESDLNEIISATTSASNSPVIDLDFTLDFDPSFPFDTNFFN